MLVLTRRLGTSIWIGEDIRVTILDIDRGSIRVGIDAPPDVEILRTELLYDHDRRLKMYNRDRDDRNKYHGEDD